MSFLITPTTAKTPLASQTQKVHGVPIQSSILGAVIPIVFGTTRIGGNLIWYGDFAKKKHKNQAAQSGKGGIVGSGSSSQSSDTVLITYSASFAWALCEGPIQDVLTVYEDKKRRTLSDEGMSLKNGNYGQAAWSYLVSNHPGEDLTYSGLAYVAVNKFDLDTSPSMPSFSYEVKALGPFAADSTNVNPADVVIALLTSNKFGAGLPSGNITALTNYRTYCDALNLWVSPQYTDQRTASSIIQDLLDLTNSVPIWTGTTLDIVPRGDEATGSYIPPQAPLFDLNDDDFVDQGPDRGPLQVLRARPSDALNAITFEYLNSNRRYSTDTVEAKDQARIDLFGLRANQSVQAHIYTDSAKARLAAQLYLQKQLIRNIYRFTLDERYMLLEPMDIVSVTDTDLGLNKQWVRIIEMTETDLGWEITAEEYLAGTGAAAIYDVSPSTGFDVDYNSAPDSANVPLFFEPTDELAGGLEVRIATSGSGPNWGGCNVYTSIDGSNYTLSGRIINTARMGVLSAPLPSWPEDALSDTTLDDFNTLSVDITESSNDPEATLISVSTSDASALSTLCYVDGEYIAFANATLTTTGKYDLTFLVRGAYGTSPVSHLAGTKFCRVDEALLALPFTQANVGTTIKVKLTSFNIYGGGEQSLASVPEYSYTLVGTALTSPLPNVADFRAVFVDNVVYLDWTEITDFRAVQYEVRKGPSWDSGQSIGRFAHPTVATQGEDKYWIAAVTIPKPNVVVYSETPTGLDLSGTPTVISLLNQLKQWDEAATGFTGTLSGFAIINGAAVSTTATGDITAASDVTLITDVANYGGQGNGIYEIPTGHQIDVGYVTAMKVTIDWASAGVSVSDNVLSLVDYLNSTDILSSADSQLVDVYPEIAVSTDGSTFGAWQKFSGAGTYNARKIKARLQLVTLQSDIIAFATQFKITVSVPLRVDHYTNQSISAGGTAITFAPDNQSAAAFNFGPAGNTSMPYVQSSILNRTAGDEVFYTAGPSLSSVTVQVKNGGVGVARSVNIEARGY